MRAVLLASAVPAGGEPSAPAEAAVRSGVDRTTMVPLVEGAGPMTWCRGPDAPRSTAAGPSSSTRRRRRGAPEAAAERARRFLTLPH
ncbi:hypothetical protein ACWD0J_38650 [Streptomyces sp. NPDC003011]